MRTWNRQVEASTRVWALLPRFPKPRRTPKSKEQESLRSSLKPRRPRAPLNNLSVPLTAHSSRARVFGGGGCLERVEGGPGWRGMGVGWGKERTRAASSLSRCPPSARASQLPPRVPKAVSRAPRDSPTATPGSGWARAPKLCGAQLTRVSFLSPSKRAQSAAPAPADRLTVTRDSPNLPRESPRRFPSRASLTPSPRERLKSLPQAAPRGTAPPKVLSAGTTGRSPLGESPPWPFPPQIYTLPARCARAPPRREAGSAPSSPPSAARRRARAPGRAGPGVGSLSPGVSGSSSFGSPGSGSAVSESA